MSAFQDEKFTLKNALVEIKILKSSLKLFILSFSNANFDTTIVSNFTKFVDSKISLPLKPKITEDTISFQGLIYGNLSVNSYLLSTLKTIYDLYLPIKTESLNALSNQILEGIKKIGFQNTKSQKEKNKHMYLYAINDHCNDCKPEWETFPLVLTVKENVLDFRIIFAINCKPGQFVQKKEIFNEEKQNEIKIEEEDLRHFNIKDKTKNQLLEFRNYLELQSSEFMPKSTKFSSQDKITKGFTSRNNLRMLYEFLDYSKKFIGNWKFIFDSSKMQVILRNTMKPLYPFHYNLQIPQDVTSEAIIYYTSFAYGIYEIYLNNKGNIDKNFLKNLKKTCKKRSKKPIIVFSLLSNKDEVIIFENQEMQTEITKTNNLLDIIKNDKNTSKIFCYNRIKIQEEKILFPKIKNAQNYKILDLLSQTIKLKTKKKFFKMISYLSKTNYYIDLREAKNFIINKGEIYYNYSKSLLSLFTEFDEEDKRFQTHYENLSEFLENLSILELSSSEMTISENEICFDKVKGKVLNGAMIEIIDLKECFSGHDSDYEHIDLFNKAIEKYSLNRCFLEGFTRRHFGILEPGNGLIIVEKILDQNRLLVGKNPDYFDKPLTKLSNSIMRVIYLYQNCKNVEVQISIKNIFIYDEESFNIKFDLITDIEYNEENKINIQESNEKLTQNKKMYPMVPEFILRFLIGIAFKLTGKYSLNINFTNEKTAKVLYLENVKDVLFELPKNAFLIDMI